jgi:hypothetical protein
MVHRGVPLALLALFLAACGDNASVRSAPPPRLMFARQPTSTVAGTDLGGVTVVLVDDTGTVRSDMGTDVTLALVTPAGGQLFGNVTNQTDAGQATFSGLSVQKAGSGYVLRATSSFYGTVDSNAFDISPGNAQGLAFSKQPVNGVAGQSFEVRVSAVDAFGNPTPDVPSVSLALRGATLVGGAPSQPATNEAVFAFLSVETAGTGYRLSATSGALPEALSDAFAIAPGPDARLGFTLQPGDHVAGDNFSTAVAVQDAYGNATGSAASITLGLSGAPLFGTTGSLAASSGLASFSGLSVQKAGSGYQLTAASGSLQPAISMPFAITAAAPVALAFAVQPRDGTAGQTWTPAVSVAILDRFGNQAGTSNAISLELHDDAGSAALSGTTSTAAASGLAAFADLNVQRAGSGYTLLASAPPLLPATSAPFRIGPAAAARLSFQQQPGTATAGEALGPVTVAIEDQYGNATTGAASVTIAMDGAPLFGTATAAAVDGVASFTDLSVQRAATGYQLTASADGFSGDTSAPFDVQPGPPARLAFAAPVGDHVAGETFGASVAVFDVYDNLSNAHPPVSVALSSAVLFGGTTSAASEGIAAFTDLSVRQAGPSYTLAASGDGLQGATSDAFAITPAADAQLAFVQQPGNVSSLTPMAVSVAVQDAYGNQTSSTAPVALGIYAGPPGAALSGGGASAAVAGLASFVLVTLDKMGTYQLSASSTGLANGQSAIFTVFPGLPASLAFRVQPRNIAAGGTMTPPVQVGVYDTGGNLTATPVSVTLALVYQGGSGTLTGTLSGTLTRDAVAGVVTFDDLSVDQPGHYLLQANSIPLASVTSSMFKALDPLAPALAYVDPTGGKIALVRNEASTGHTIVLDLIVREPIGASSVALDLPLDLAKVQANTELMTPGPSLPDGAGLVSADAELAETGPSSGLLISAQSPQSGGLGSRAVLLAGTLLYTLRLDLKPGATAGTVFDGATLADHPMFRALLRDSSGKDVATPADFAIGKLEVRAAE